MTNDQIFEACDQILAETGDLKKVTNARVREALGFGSFATISPVVKDWKKQKTTIIKVENTTPVINEASEDREPVKPEGAIDLGITNEELNAIDLAAQWRAAAMVVAIAQRSNELANTGNFTDPEVIEAIQKKRQTMPLHQQYREMIQ